MSCEDTEWIQERITKTKALIVAYEDAILALASGAQTYSLNTGQTTQSVTKANLSSMRMALDALEDRLRNLQNQLTGSGVFIGRPAF
jgi:hypothetical protein